MIQIGWKTDENMDVIVLIDGEKVDDESEWKGLTQTVKKVIVKENAATKQYFK